MITTYERGIIAGERKLALRLLEAKFGTLSQEVKQRLEALTPEALEQLTVDLLKGQSLKELGLQN